MKKNKSNVKKFAIVFTSINALLILALTAIYIFQLNKNKEFIKKIIFEKSHYTATEKVETIKKIINRSEYKTYKDFYKELKSLSENDNQILNIAIFTKTLDENFFRVKSIIKLNKNIKLPFRKNQKIGEKSNENFIKKGRYELTLDPSLYSQEVLFWHNVYCPKTINNKRYVLKFSINTTSIVNSLSSYIDNEKINRNFIIITALSFIFILLIISILYANSHSAFINRLTSFVEKASHGNLEISINEKANADITKLANSFNTLIDDLKEKEKKINNLENKDNLSDIFKAGVKFLKINKIDQSISIFKTLTIIKPNGFASYFNLGVAYIKNKNFDKSIMMFEKALELNPEHIDTKACLEKANKLKIFYETKYSNNTE